VTEAALFTVGPGDSWLSVRTRMCPVEEIQAANPALAARTLRQGDRIKAPFVPVSRLEHVTAQLREAEGRVVATRAAADARAAEADATIAALHTRLAELESIATERDAAVSQSTSAWALVVGVSVATAALAAALGVLGLRLLAVHRSGAARDERLRELDTQYTDLRRTLNDLDLQLQRRMLQLVSWHDSGGLTERQIADAAAPVLDLARRLKERHAR
jgi:hypothetical protein